MINRPPYKPGSIKKACNKVKEQKSPDRKGT